MLVVGDGPIPILFGIRSDPVPIPPVVLEWGTIGEGDGGGGLLPPVMVEDHPIPELN